MASAASYSFLLIDQFGQDRLLYDTQKLLETISTTRLKRARIRQQKIDAINKQLPLADPIVAGKLQEILADLSKQSDDVTIDDIKQTHGVFLNSKFKPWVESTSEYSKVSVNSKPAFGERVVFDVPSYGNFLSDMCLHLRIGDLHPESKEDKVRYANMLGHRMIRKVELIINNVVIDSYPGEYYNVYYETRLSKDKKAAWHRCMGQELPVEGELTADPLASDYRQVMKLFNGAQTLKSSQPELELFIPLLFWFNIDKKCALMNNYPPGTVKVAIELAKDNVLMTCLDTVSEIYHEKYKIPEILESELYTNHIFVSDDIQSVFSNRIGFNLIRTHKFAEVILDKNTDSINIVNYMRYPVEEFIVYGRPVENEEGLDSLNTWNLNHSLSMYYKKECVAFKDVDGSYAIGINNVKIYESKEIFSKAEMSFDGVATYEYDNPIFFSAYLPLRQERTLVKKAGMMYFPYNMFPREYDPSGYAALGKSKKINFSYESDIIEDKDVKLYIHAIAINFLVFNGSSAMLNYY